MQDCHCCSKKYEIGNYNFYHLCDECFNQFDNQKMNGRFSFGKVDYYENVKDFINAKICTHDCEINNIKNFYCMLQGAAK